MLPENYRDERGRNMHFHQADREISRSERKEKIPVGSLISTVLASWQHPSVPGKRVGRRGEGETDCMMGNLFLFSLKLPPCFYDGKTDCQGIQSGEAEEIRWQSHSATFSRGLETHRKLWDIFRRYFRVNNPRPRCGRCVSQECMHRTPQDVRQHLRYCRL